ncbi:MAG TPA: 6-hydroxymethylpterin diphosphokinase MptE-like protein, partial [Spirochaetota bacterium]|nr:6-hydroxymethylpterin diphosphokinase MptE-like protein [Spirochaetota bacterium]
MIIEDKAKDGSVIFKQEQDGKTFYLSSRYNPSREAERITADAEEFKDCNIIILFGAGNLHLISKINGLRTDQLFIVLVKSEQFKKKVVSLLKKNYDLEAAAENIIFCSEKDYKSQIRELILKRSARRIRFLQNRNEIRMNPAFFAEARTNIINMQNRKSINTATISRFEKLWLRNIIKNTDLIINAFPLKQLLNTGKGYQAVIIGAGPSLAPELENLKKNQQHLVLIAVDTVYKTLLNHNIIPDIVIIVDPQKINAKYLENIEPRLIRQSFFISEPAVCTKAIADKKHNLIMFDTIFPYYNILASFFGFKGELDMGGSVATTAFEVCRLLGFDRTTMLGMDLSLSKDRYHLPGTMYEQQWYSSCSRLSTYDTQTFKLVDYANLEQTRNNHNQTVYMDAKFIMFKNWFEKKIKKFPDFNISNSSDGGAVIKGIEYIPFTEFTATAAGLHKNKYRAVLTDTISYTTQPKKIISVLPLFLEKMQNISSRINSYRELCIKAEKAASRAAAKLSRREDPGAEFSTLQALDTRLGLDFPGKALVNIAVQKIIHKINDGYEIEFDHQVTERQRPAETSRYLYSEMRRACSLNLKYINNTVR